MREARRDIDAVVDALKARTGRLVTTGDIGAARAEARAALDKIAARVVDGDGPTSSPPSLPAGASAGQQQPAVEGDRVAVGPLGLEGIVQSVRDGHAEIDVRGKRMRAKLGDLRVLVPAAAIAASPSRVRVTVDLAPRAGGSLTEINVIGNHADEAVGRVDRFLEDAGGTDLRSLRIVHGYGTGTLRRAIGEFLRKHPLVASFGPAPDNQGGGGVTVVELKE